MPKQRRRDNGSGSLHQDRHGQWWAISPPEEGTGKRTRRRAKDRADARAKLTQMLKDRAGGVRLTLKDPTLAEFFALWIEQSNWEPKTRENHECNTRLYLCPRLGKIKLSALTLPALLRNQNALMREDGKAAGTAASARRSIRAALNVAVKWGYLATNPAKDLPVPKDAIPRERKVWSAAQARRFLAWVATCDNGQPHPLWRLFIITLYLGLRRGEGCGLRWQDVDFQRRTIRIVHTVVQLKDRAHAKKTKNEESARTVPMSTKVEQTLRDQLAYVQRLLPDDVESEYVFPTSKGTPYQPTNVRSYFVDLIKAYNKQAFVEVLPIIRYHDMRHTCATILLEEGVDLKFVSAILGHSTINVTANLYAHVTERGSRRVVETMDKAMEG